MCVGVSIWISITANGYCIRDPLLQETLKRYKKFSKSITLRYFLAVYTILRQEVNILPAETAIKTYAGEVLEIVFAFGVSQVIHNVTFKIGCI